MASGVARKKEWVLTETTLDKLLDSLDPDRERAGVRYRALHEMLVKFFEWQCSCSPNEHADETINRVARRIEGGEQINNIQAYTYGVAKLLLCEVLKERRREEAAYARMSVPIQSAALEREENDLRRDCFDKCLSFLTDNNREIILAYYAGEQRTKIEERKRIAERLGADLNALRVRAHRIRAKLEQCVRTCIG